MRTKSHRLSGKQINWLLGRGRKLYGKHLVCVAFPQRHFLPYTQRSLTIPVKLDKRAAMRNALKRRGREIFIHLFREEQRTRQLFFFCNKQTIETSKQIIATRDKTTIFTYRNEACTKDFTYFLHQLGTPSPQFSTNGPKHGSRERKK